MNVIIKPLHSPPLPRSFITNELQQTLFIMDTAVTGDCVPSVININEFSDQTMMTQVNQLLLHSSVNEVAMTLLFSDNSTLLNEESSTKHNDKQDIKVEALLMVVSVRNVLSHIKLHLVPCDSYAHIWTWIRNLLLRVLSTLTVIGYKMVELLSTIVSHFKLAELMMSSLLNWSVCDVGLASFLVNHDDHTLLTMPYDQLLSMYGFDTSRLHKGDDYLDTVGILMNHLYHLLKNNNQWDIYVNIEMKSIPIVSVMESCGVAIDSATLNKYERILQSKLMVIEHSIYSIVGHQFNVNSVPQLKKILYDDLKLHHNLQGFQQQQLSTSEQTLMLIQDKHPLPGAILQYRQVHKIKCLVMNLKECLIEGDCIKPCWHLIGTCTGRMSANHPNIQGLPKYPLLLKQANVDDVVVDIRGCIISRPNHSFIIFDFKSIELCLLAELSGDVQLISILKEAQTNKTDVFKHMASRWLSLEYGSITNEEREKTKRVVYSLIYGMGKEKLSQLLNISIESSQQLIGSFLDYYESVKNFISSTIQHCRKTKHCGTICGRLRLFSDIHSSNYKLRTSAERQCVNYCIQGSAADVCKIVMIQIQQKLIERHIEGRLVVQVHDELIYEVNDQYIEDLVHVVKEVTTSKDLLMKYMHKELQVSMDIRMTCNKQWKSKDKTVFVTKEDARNPPIVSELVNEADQYGVILPDGSINWDCPCLGGLPTGPCGSEFKSSFGCFHYSSADPKGSDCIEQFIAMQECFKGHPELYSKFDNNEENEVNNNNDTSNEETSNTRTDSSND